MLGTLNGPWLVCGAALLLGVVLRRETRGSRSELLAVAVLLLLGATARLMFGLWAPLHVNGQGPLWIRGALDAGALLSYGPGYFELFHWVARLSAPERGIFAANAILSALNPVLLYVVARAIGVTRRGAFAAAFVLAADAVTIRTAASELYIIPIGTLVLAAQLALALFARASTRGDGARAACALVAASLFGIAAVRIHLLALLPLALSPLVVLCASQPESWSARILLAIESATAMAGGILLSTGGQMLNAWQQAPVSGDSVSAGFESRHVALLTLLCVAVWLLRRQARPSWLPLLSVFTLPVLWTVQRIFQLHPFQQLFYARLCWPALLLGVAALVPNRLDWRWLSIMCIVVTAALQISALPYLTTHTTEQNEHAFLQEVLAGLPGNCRLAAVNRAERRVWEIPTYLLHGSTRQEIDGPSRLRDLVQQGECVVYVHSSLCSSAEGRPLCEAAEQGVPLEYVASRVFPAAPSYLDLPYDRSAVEVVVSRAAGHAVDTARAESGVSDGVPITPEFAQSLFDQLKTLHEPDRCQLAAFDTSRFRITIGLQTATGAQHRFDVASQASGAADNHGGWTLAVPAELERDCGASIAAIERVLGATAAPTAPQVETTPMHRLLAGLFVLLVCGTAIVLRREILRQQPSPYAVAALVVLWAVALALRCTLSPRTFLHEYYHIAETVETYLVRDGGALYGKTGPALFRLVAAIVGSKDSPNVIFFTNAVLSSLAIPALALLALALTHSWAQALCAGVLLAVLPLHLRFSAAEDLFVQALTFGLWTLALFALYLRTSSVFDAVLAAIALALAMQVRPEMLVFPLVVVALVVLVRPRAWRMLFAWRTLLAVCLAAVLLLPRVIELGAVLHDPPAVASGGAGNPFSYFSRLVLLDSAVTPPLYWLLLCVGLACGIWERSGVVLWCALVFVGYTAMAQGFYDNPPYNLRSQILPCSLVMLVAGATAPAWMRLWGTHRRQALGVGAALLSISAVYIVIRSRPFVTERRDQQLEYAFLERTVPQLPQRARLLAATDVGGRNLDAFPEFLLSRSQKTYALIDVRHAASGEQAWPPPGEDLLYYQGMFCFFSFAEEESPEPMTVPCRAVHARYELEPLVVETLDTRGYSYLHYAAGPYPIGFYRLRRLR